MNTYITLACLMAVAAVGHGSAIGTGWGGLGIGSVGWGGVGIGGVGWDGLGWNGVGLGSKVIVAPAAVSSANLYKAAPIPVLRTWASAPVIRAPIVAPVAPLGLGWSGVNPWGYGLGSLGKGWGTWGGWGKI